jgi:hypothetical protein
MGDSINQSCLMYYHEKRQGHSRTLPANYHHLSHQSSFKTVPGVAVSASILMGCAD